MNFQGTLYQDGGPVTDTMDMWFGIYDAVSGGTLLYSVTNTNVAVINGWFSTMLTNIPNSVFPVSGPTRYLEIKAPATQPPLTPRLQLASVGYSYHSITADTAEYAKVSAGGVDNAWVRGTPDSVLYTIRQLGITRGGANNMLYGNYRYTHTNLGVACTTGTSGQNYSYCTVGGGNRNTASGIVATVSGGGYNTANGGYALVGGGYSNTANGGYATVAGGFGDTASGGYATISGGYDNTAGGGYAIVSGGYKNTASNNYTTVGGGYVNTASGQEATVAGGFKNSASDIGATVSGGYDDTASARAATVSGGARNHATGVAATVSGGSDNTAGADYAAVPGGNYNVAQGRFSFAAGRQANSQHTGSFVWADSTNATFSSTSPNQFLIRATNGVGIGTNDPQVMLDVAGKFKCQNAIAEVWDTIPTSTTSQNYVDLPGMSITVNTTNSRLFIDFVGSCSVSSGHMWFRLILDGVKIGFTYITAGAGNTTASILRMPIVSAGNHTVKVQWMVGGSNTGYCPEAIDGITSAGTRTLTVIEYW